MAVNVYLKNQLRRLRRPIPFDFGKLRIKGRNVLGNIVTKNQVERISRIMPSAAEPEGDTPLTPETEMPESPLLTPAPSQQEQSPTSEVPSL